MGPDGSNCSSHFFVPQVVSIITDETPIEQLRNRLLKEANREVAHTRKPKIALLREVFGRGGPGPGPGQAPWSTRAVRTGGGSYGRKHGHNVRGSAAHDSQAVSQAWPRVGSLSCCPHGDGPLGWYQLLSLRCPTSNLAGKA